MMLFSRLLILFFFTLSATTKVKAESIIDFEFSNSPNSREIGLFLQLSPELTKLISSVMPLPERRDQYERDAPYLFSRLDTISENVNGLHNGLLRLEENLTSLEQRSRLVDISIDLHELSRAFSGYGQDTYNSNCSSFSAEELAGYVDEVSRLQYRMEAVESYIGDRARSAVIIHGLTQILASQMVLAEHCGLSLSDNGTLRLTFERITLELTEKAEEILSVVSEVSEAPPPITQSTSWLQARLEQGNTASRVLNCVKRSFDWREYERPLGIGRAECSTSRVILGISWPPRLGALWYDCEVTEYSGYVQDVRIVGTGTSAQLVYSDPVRIAIDGAPLTRHEMSQCDAVDRSTDAFVQELRSRAYSTYDDVSTTSKYYAELSAAAVAQTLLPGTASLLTDASTLLN